MKLHNIIKSNVSVPVDKKLEKVLAFHCSGGSPSHHRALDTLLGAGMQLDSPEYFGTRFRGPWYSDNDFTLANEASRTIQKMDVERCNSYHLVGHSYGGALALHIALARPELIRSLTLYEPCVFNLLKYAGNRGQTALNEITSLAERVVNAIVDGDRSSAMMTFVDYWNEEGTWATLADTQQRQLMSGAAKIPQEFDALINENTPLKSLHCLTVPTKIIYGEFAPTPTYIGSVFLATMLGNGHSSCVKGAGHMGPLTNSHEVATIMKNHIELNRIATNDDMETLPEHIQSNYLDDRSAA